MTTDPFRELTDTYESWFETFEAAYRAEIAALESLWKPTDRALSVGVGSGRFAEPLGVEYGIDPAPEMLEIAREHGIEVTLGVGERLPFRAESFESALMVTTVCFLDDLDDALAEIYRVLEVDGSVVLGFIDKQSPVGKRYQAIKDENPFYRDASFYGADELASALAETGFGSIERRQTIFTMPEEMDEPDSVNAGSGEGSFVAMRASR
ncbi:MAG: class I SAM-dependent methyltransferase [Halodesulfurarchaeum sp.]